jgi:tetratricopeptide (TPR) repeat protein
MSHPRAQPARQLLWILAIVNALSCASTVVAQPATDQSTPPATADASDESTWPLFALREARDTAATVGHPHRRTQALEQVAAASSGLGDCATARAILVEAIDAARAIKDIALRDLALRDLAKRQAACRDSSGALATLGQITAPDDRDAVSMAVVSAQVQAGSLEDARRIADAITDSVRMSDAERLIALAHARAGRMGEASDVAEHIPDFLVRAMTSADIALLHADLGNAEALNNARLIARNTPNTRQRDVALSYVAGIQAESGDIHGALATSGAIKDGTSKAYALTRIANERSDTVDDPAVPELLNRAWSTARRAKPTGATAAVMCEIAQSFVQRGNNAQARIVLDHALAIATSKRNVRYNVATVERIARVRARTGDISGALAIADSIPDSSARALLIHDILAAQAETGDAAGAIRTAATLGNERLQVAALFGIVGVQMTGGDASAARASLQRILEIARATRDPGFRSHSLGAVAAAQVELGDRTEAWPTFNDALAAAADVPDPYSRALAYVNLSDPFTARP